MWQEANRATQNLTGAEPLAVGRSRNESPVQPPTDGPAAPSCQVHTSSPPQTPVSPSPRALLRIQTVGYPWPTSGSAAQVKQKPSCGASSPCPASHTISPASRSEDAPRLLGRTLRKRPGPPHFFSTPGQDTRSCFWVTV